MALVEDNEMLYNQTTRELKKTRQTKTECSQILDRQLVSVVIVHFIYILSVNSFDLLM